VGEAVEERDDAIPRRWQSIEDKRKAAEGCSREDE